MGERTITTYLSNSHTKESYLLFHRIKIHAQEKLELLKEFGVDDHKIF